MSAFRTVTAARSAHSFRPRRAGSFRPRKAGRLLSGATAVALAALAMTACDPDSGTVTGGAPTGSTSAAPTLPSGSGTGGGQDQTSTGAGGNSGQTGGGKATGGTGSGSGTGSGGAKGTTGGSGSEDRVLCNGSNTAVTVENVTRPLNTMLITVKNTGSKTCDLTYYPVLRFDEMQWAPTARKDTQPQAVVTLAPGASGYAAALLSAGDGSSDGGQTGHKLTVAFQGRTPDSSGGASATPTLPAKGVYYDNSLTVTYWRQDMADALS
jgi:hypothetical protein